GAAPQSQNRLDVRTVALDVPTLVVKRTQGRWVVGDKGRALLDFATQAEAEQALAVIRKHHFDQVGVIGQATPMHVFFGKGTDSPAAKPRQEPTHFSRLAKESDGTPKKQASATPSPNAFVVQPGLPPVTRPVTGPTGPTQPTLTSRQAPLWREQPH